MDVDFVPAHFNWDGDVKTTLDTESMAMLKDAPWELTDIMPIKKRYRSDRPGSSAALPLPAPDVGVPVALADCNGDTDGSGEY